METSNEETAVDSWLQRANQILSDFNRERLQRRRWVRSVQPGYECTLHDGVEDFRSHTDAWWRVFRDSATYAKPDAACCAWCRHYQGRCCTAARTEPVPVLPGDWCGAYDASDPEKAFTLPSASWEPFIGTRECSSCRQCLYGVGLTRGAVCRRRPPTNDAYAFFWIWRHRTGDFCDTRVYARPASWRLL